MQKDREITWLGQTMCALAMGMLTFALPPLLFGGTGLAETAEPKESVLPAVPSPVAVTAEPSPSPEPEVIPDTGTGELDRAQLVRVAQKDGSVVEVSMADYLWGVVAAEMPASFELEALKAQAVAARTYTMWKTLHRGVHGDGDVCTNYNCCQAWISRGAAEANWGENSAVYAARIDEAVTLTDGQLLLLDGGPIQAVFHASSAKQTEDAAAVWGSEVPYLVGVDTPEGEEVPNYHTTVFLTAGEVREALEPLGCDLSADPSLWFESMTYTQGGSVASAQVGGEVLRGSTLRLALGLRSATFEVEYGEDGFTFSVTGNGHGVGMSQYGANALAREGKPWREIVRWYYTGTEIGDYSALATPAGA